MRVCVVGAHGTGKTTICRAISEQLKFNIIPDVVAKAFRLHFTINENTPPESQFWILSKQLELERNTPTPWIMEKSLWDNIIYGSFSIKDKQVLSVIENIVDANANYDLVFYLPIEFPIPDDGLRSLDVNFQRFVDQELTKYLHTRKIKYHTLSGSGEQRVSKALQIIKEIQSSIIYYSP